MHMYFSLVFFTQRAASCKSQQEKITKQEKISQQENTFLGLKCVFLLTLHEAAQVYIKVK